MWARCSPYLEIWTICFVASQSPDLITMLLAFFTGFVAYNHDVGSCSIVCPKDLYIEQIGDAIIDLIFKSRIAYLYFANPNLVFHLDYEAIMFLFLSMSSLMFQVFNAYLLNRDRGARPSFIMNPLFRIITFMSMYYLMPQ